MPSSTTYLQGPSIGSGGQATIHLLRISQSHPSSPSRLLVAKILKPQYTFTPSTLSVLSHLHTSRPQCPYLLEIFELPVLESRRLVLEYCDGGDLGQLIKRFRSKGRNMPEGLVWYFLKGLAEAVSYLHTGGCTPAVSSSDQGGATTAWRPIIHRDLKPANILLTRSSLDRGGYPLLKVADFDLATFYDDDEEEELKEPFYGGTYRWQPPEQWADPFHPRAKPAGDIWAVGAIVHAMCTGRAPMPDGECAEGDDEADCCRWDVGDLEGCEESVGEREERLREEVRIRGLPRVIGDIRERGYSRELEDVMRWCLEEMEGERVTAGALVGLVVEGQRRWIGVDGKGEGGLDRDSVVEEEVVFEYQDAPEDWQFHEIADDDNGDGWGCAGGMADSGYAESGWGVVEEVAVGTSWN